jgi:hypothetical protein
VGTWKLEVGRDLEVGNEQKEAATGDVKDNHEAFYSDKLEFWF